ncbi:Metallo-dependent phosphatase [Neoconidiobolus thromboides FSU 785]|nr:Metallo-dependent phosphatase [Neoconidiobolus thromboides FSU 785]
MNLFSTLIAAILLVNNSLVECQSDSYRVVAVGDLHGDYDNMIKILQMTKVINEEHEWIGGSHTTLVQTGDVTDRGPDAKKIYTYFMKLRQDASSKGGLFVPLLGNHETKNMIENYKDVSKQDISAFGSEKERKQEFSESGIIGKYLRNLDITAKVHDTVFCHGGVNLDWSKKKVDGLNKEFHELVSSESKGELKESEIFSKEGDGPLWYRGYAKDDEDEVCSKLTKALDNLGAKRMVMGHTIQKNNKITTRCNNRAILIDIAISSFYDGGHLGAFEFTDSYMRAVYPNGKFEYFGKAKEVSNDSEGLEDLEDSSD